MIRNDPNMFLGRCNRRMGLLVPLVVTFLTAAPALGQPFIFDNTQDSWRKPIVPLLLDGSAGSALSSSQTSYDGSDRRVRLFRMPTSFWKDPVGLELDDDGSTDRAMPPVTDEDLSSDTRLQVALGTDNPFFDFRYPGDPGGVGYYRLNSQYQLMDKGLTSLSVALQAVTPAGMEDNGLASGPTTFSPALALSQELGGGVAVHAFVGKHMRAAGGWTDGLEHGVQYGLALQSPLTSTDSRSNQSLHMFIEALAHNRCDWETGQNAAIKYEMLPGLHWQVGENWWLSGGVAIPFSSPRPENGLWQLTCSWRF